MCLTTQSKTIKGSKEFQLIVSPPFCLHNALLEPAPEIRSTVVMLPLASNVLELYKLE